MKASRGSYFMRLVFLIFFCFSLLAQDATSPIDPVLDWLPLDTETLVVANYQQTILQALGGANANDPSADLQYQHFAQIPSFLFTANTLLNKKMVYAATAARRFRLPPVTAQGLIPLGSGLYDSCTFIQYDQPVNDVVSQALAAYPRESVAGQAAWIVTFQPHQQIGGIPNYRAWIVMLKPDLFLISPDRDFLETVLQRARKPKADKRAFPADSPIRPFGNGRTRQPHFGECESMIPIPSTIQRHRSLPSPGHGMTTKQLHSLFNTTTPHAL